MSLSLRYFFIDDTGQIHPVPLARYERIFSGQEAVPQYAGRKMRVAEVSVELVNGMPARTLRDAFSFLAFDGAGHVDQRFTDDYMRAASEAVSGAVLDKMDSAKSGGVLQAGGRFAKRRLEQTHQWQPDYQLRKKILDQSLEKPSRRTGNIGIVPTGNLNKLRQTARERTKRLVNLTDVPSYFYGRWRITRMSDFDTKALDEDVPAFMKISSRGRGSFQFGLVQGEIDAGYAILDGRPFIAFCWQGSDQGEDASGRGEAIIHSDGMLTGTFYVFRGASHTFAAERKRK